MNIELTKQELRKKVSENWKKTKFNKQNIFTSMPGIGCCKVWTKPNAKCENKMWSEDQIVEWEL